MNKRAYLIRLKQQRLRHKQQLEAREKSISRPASRPPLNPIEKHVAEKVIIPEKNNNLNDISQHPIEQTIEKMLQTPEQKQVVEDNSVKNKIAKIEETIKKSKINQETDQEINERIKKYKEKLRRKQQSRARRKKRRKK